MELNVFPETNINFSAPIIKGEMINIYYQNVCTIFFFILTGHCDFIYFSGLCFSFLIACVWIHVFSLKRHVWNEKKVIFFIWNVRAIKNCFHVEVHPASQTMTLILLFSCFAPSNTNQFLYKIAPLSLKIKSAGIKAFNTLTFNKKTWWFQHVVGLYFLTRRIYN